MFICVAWAGTNSVLNANPYSFVTVADRILRGNFKSEYYNGKPVEKEGFSSRSDVADLNSDWRCM